MKKKVAKPLKAAAGFKKKALKTAPKAVRPMPMKKGLQPVMPA